MSTLTQIIADAYRKMVNPPAPIPAARPKWVPASITEESVPAFIQAVTEARKANQSVVKFNGKKYGINETIQKTNKRPERPSVVDAHNKEVAARAEKVKGKMQKEDTSEEDQGKAKKIQDMDAENAPKQASDEVPSEVKEEDSEEIKMDNHDEKEKDAEEMQRIAASEAPGDKRAEMAEKLVGNQHKLDVNKNGKIDGEDLKKLRGEEKEEDSEEEHPEPDADNMGGPSDHDADNKDEDEKPKMTGEQTIASVAATYAAMVNEEDEYAGDNPVDKLHFDVPAFIKVLEKAREDFKSDEDIHNFTQALLAMKSDCIHTADLPSSPMKEGTSADAEAGPEVMDPATYAAMVNENVAGDPHAHNLTNKANGLTALAHSSNSDTHHEDAKHAHNLAAEHYRVYAHHAGDPQIRSAANIHHEFHRSMANHHMLHLVSADQDREASDAAAKHYGKKSVEEGTAADAEAGPEVMDPATQKMKDDADDETEIKDGVPGSAQDGADDLNPADKPAPANKSAALPKAEIIDAPVTTNESVSEKQEVDEKYTAIVSRKHSDGSYSEVGMNNRTVIHGSHSNILKKAKEYAKGPHRIELFHGDRVGYGSPHKVIHSE